MESTKIKIGFNELEYNNTVSIFYANKEILFNALQEAERIVGTPPAIKTFMNGFVSCVMEQIKAKHIDAAKLGLSDEKLLSLFNYDLKKLIELESFYNFSITKEPNENDFAIFAETPEEIARLKKCEALAKAWEDLQTDFGSPLKPNFYVHYKNNQNTNALQANIAFVKRGF